MSTDTKLTDLVVNTLTRKQYHEADLTGHDDELFVQSDHAGVFVGGNGVDAIDTTNTSNCIAEIPQDIKLELNAGTLTLKAGSKVYVPNGAGVFDVITIANDITRTISANDKHMIFVQQNGTATSYRRVSTQTASGTTTPTSSYWAYYNTTDNKIYQIDNGVNTLQLSFPICVVTVSGGAITNIDQVFNGFGYVGSTVFVLPEVKGLIPNGRNADGTLKNSIATTTTVMRHTSSYWYGHKNIYVASNNLYISDSVVYDEKTNTMNAPNVFEAGTIDLNSNFVIQSISPKTVFHAVDYSDTEYMAHQAMPSDKYVDLTLPASGNSITAPADGIFVVTKASSNSLQYLNIQTPNRNEMAAVAQSSGQNVTASLLVSKGDVVTAYYNLGGATQVCRLIYANGAK